MSSLFSAEITFFLKNNEDEMQTWGDWPIVMLKQKKDMTKKKKCKKKAAK